MSRLIVSFTDEGAELAASVMKRVPEFKNSIFFDMHSKKASGREGLHKLIKERFDTGECILFIGACGIAVREIAPYVKDKMTDPPVIVMDQKGSYVIPLLSGHIGGANDISLRISEAIGGEAVITTATDVKGVFAVDSYARDRGLELPDKETILAMSSGSVAGKKVEIKEDLFEHKVYIKTGEAETVLKFKPYIIGIGCKSGTLYHKIEVYINNILDDYNISINEIGLVATVDLKKDEAGILEWCDVHRKKLITFTPEQLMEQKGDFIRSDFVMKTTGADNICERAVAAAGARLVVRKMARYGITVAIGKTT